jgi:hypothetical protein
MVMMVVVGRFRKLHSHSVVAWSSVYGTNVLGNGGKWRTGIESSPLFSELTSINNMHVSQSAYPTTEFLTPTI